MEETNACIRNIELTTVLDTHFKGKLNLARLKLISLFVCSVCKVRTVAFDKLANAFGHTATTDSSFRRLQRFVAGFALDGDLVGRLVFSLLPECGKVKLTIERTNWQFGQTDIHIFMLVVVYQGVAFQLFFTMLPKRGNSNSAERIELVERFISFYL